MDWERTIADLKPLWFPPVPGKVAAIKADQYVIATEGAGYYNKFFQINFGRDGSIFVSLPYYTGVPGVVGLWQIPKNDGAARAAPRYAAFSVTSHAVKYSHHPNGRAHFSLTGKVRTDIKKQAAEFQQANGHIFTVMVQGMAKFKAQSYVENSTPKRAIVPFSVWPEPRSMKFAAHLFSESEMLRRFDNEPNTPFFLARDNIGVSHGATLLATPFTHNGESYFLQITLIGSDFPLDDKEVFLGLIGGFDPPDHAFDETRDRSCLICIYPKTGDLEEMRKQFGTIDLDYINKPHGGFGLV